MFDEDNKMDHDIEKLRRHNAQHDDQAKDDPKNNNDQGKTDDQTEISEDDLEALNYIDEPSADNEAGEVTEPEQEDEAPENDGDSQQRDEDVEEAPEETSDEDAEPEEQSNEPPKDDAESPEEEVEQNTEAEEQSAETETTAQEQVMNKTSTHPPIVVVVALLVMLLLVAVAFWAYQTSKENSQVNTGPTIVVPATQSDIVEEINDVDAVLQELDKLGTPEDLPADGTL